jgi:hypothetical protein
MYTLDLTDLEGLTDVCFTYVTDPHPSRSAYPVIESLQDVAPQVVEVLEAMVLDGVDEQHEVEDYLNFVFKK